MRLVEIKQQYMKDHPKDYKQTKNGSVMNQCLCVVHGGIGLLMRVELSWG